MEEPACVTPSKFSCSTCTLKGFLPTLLFAALAASVPVTLYYMDYDFDDNVVRGTCIGISAAVALGIVFANDCATWYNMVLFFHTGLEVQIVDLAFTYAYAEDTLDKFMPLALTVIVIKEAS